MSIHIYKTTGSFNVRTSYELTSIVTYWQPAICFLILIYSLALIIPASAVAQSTPSDSEKQMVEEAGKLFVWLSTSYKSGSPDIDYVLSRFKNKDHYRFKDTASKATYRIEDLRFRESFGHRMILRFNKNMYQITLGPETTHLFDFWDNQLLWRLAKAGILTTDRIEKTDDNGAINHIYHPSQSDTTANWQIRLRSIPDEGGAISTRFTAGRENDNKRK